MSEFREIQTLLQHRSYWNYKYGQGYSHNYTRWMDGFPDIKSGKVTPQQHITNTIPKLSASEAIDILPIMISQLFGYYTSQGGTDGYLLDELVKTHNIRCDHTMFEKIAGNGYVSSFTILVEKVGYLPTIAQLIEPIDEATRKRSRYGDNCENWLQKILVGYCNGYSNSPKLLEESFKKILENDSCATKKFIVSPEFTKNFDFEKDRHRQVYGYCINILFTESIQLLTFLKILKRGIPYDCLSGLAKLCNFTETDKCTIIEHVYVEDYIPGNETVITENMDIIEKNEGFDMSEIVTWMCRSQQRSVIDTIQKLHKKLHFKFLQKHLDLLCNNPSDNYTLIKYILENSSRDDVVVTRRIFEQVLSTGKVPRHVSMIIQYIKLEGDK